MTVNKQLLKDAVEWVEWQDTLEPGQRAWVQDDWVTLREEEENATCGTAYCVAGWIGVTQLPGQFLDSDYGDYQGELIHVADFAETMLGGSSKASVDHELALEGDNAGFPDGYGRYSYDLFHADNTAKDIRTIAEAMAGEKL